MVEALADGGEASLAHLSQSAATGSAAPRPKRSPHLIFAPSCEAGAKSVVKSLQFSYLAMGHAAQPKRPPTPARADGDTSGSAHLS